MPCKVTIYPDRDLAVVVASGQVDASDIVEAIQTTYCDRQWKPHFRVIWDAQKITLLDVAPTDVGRIVAGLSEVAHLRGPGKTAVVVSRGIDFIMASLLQKKSEGTGRDVRIMQDIKEACEWLGVAVALSERMSET